MRRLTGFCVGVYLELTLDGVAAPDGQFIAPGDIITPP